MMLPFVRSPAPIVPLIEASSQYFPGWSMRAWRLVSGRASFYFASPSENAFESMILRLGVFPLKEPLGIPHCFRRLLFYVSALSTSDVP